MGMVTLLLQPNSTRLIANVLKYLLILFQSEPIVKSFGPNSIQKSHNGALRNPLHDHQNGARRTSPCPLSYPSLLLRFPLLSLQSPSLSIPPSPIPTYPPYTSYPCSPIVIL